MSYQEEEQTRLRRQSSKQAIALAMQGRWQEAISANKLLMENFPNDVDACNRLGKAYMELGEYSHAKEAYEKALQIDPYNIIAKKNLGRLTHLIETVGSGGAAVAVEAQKVEPQQFIEEVGKAGVVNLHHLAPPDVLARTVAGSRGELAIEGANLVVKNARGEYLGLIEPRHGQRLAKLMQGGNEYSSSIINSSEEAVTVIIRETFQHPSQAGQLSFPPKGSEPHRPYVGDRIIRRELEYEEALPGEPTYTIVGGDEPEFLAEESTEIEEEEEEE